MAKLLGKSGTGVAKEYRWRSFETYRSMKGEGRGDGLDIARRIAIEHGEILSYEPTSLARDGSLASGHALVLTLPRIE